MRIVSIVLLAASTFVLAGCPDKDAKPDPASAKPSATPAATAPASAAPAKSAGGGW